jgi:hypothetical protein
LQCLEEDRANVDDLDYSGLLAARSVWPTVILPLNDGAKRSPSEITGKLETPSSIAFATLRAVFSSIL